MKPVSTKMSRIQDQLTILKEWRAFEFFGIRLMDKLAHDIYPMEVKLEARPTDINAYTECRRCLKSFRFRLMQMANGDKFWRLTGRATTNSHHSYELPCYDLDYDSPQAGIELLSDIDDNGLFCSEVRECHIDRKEFKKKLYKLAKLSSKYFEHCFLHKATFKRIVAGYMTQGDITYTRARTAAFEGRCRVCNMTFGIRVDDQIHTFFLGGPSGKSILIEKADVLNVDDWLVDASKRIRNETNITFKNQDYAHFACTRLEILK
jgi:hypothetical protein